MMLSERAYCVSALAIKLGLSAPAISQHLRILRDSGIVYCEKYGYHTHYKLSKERVLELSAAIAALEEEKPDICKLNGYRCDASEQVGCRKK